MVGELECYQVWGIPKVAHVLETLGYPLGTPWVPMGTFITGGEVFDSLTTSWYRSTRFYALSLIVK